ncbi:transcriptional regulator [Frankia sp. CcI156]|jgi:transcriptional regulator with XRE-family HTH domain|uniref:Transcriptional regulator, XRE family n=2 Tax=Frankia TaxID=1854 RepID=Q2JFN5_FRACC|nr:MULTISPECIES: helix-turn-helix transcriptional regulator [Frankia]ABD09907.1 transcriptional regulator, XRE family [Frankia casuarinae]ETA04384.1 putative transcriptional regulator [Frankia sp. CcI6]EYT90214.1 putative transcriptional regulator [Frankia casuarinae]KDA44918.1 putative transcriptional regulator [Frankia sp. BMG5.23]OAA29821.1 putative transcriptional regulator [Frankia casuarinae]
MRQRSRGRHDAATAEDLLPAEVRRRRCERVLSREELARRTGYSRQYIGQLEQPSRGIPSRPVIAAVDAALEAGGALIDLREAAVAARAERLRRRPDPERESRRRVSDLLDHRRSDTELDYLDRLVADLIAKADRLDPQDVTAQVLEQQNVVDNLLHTPMLPHQQFRLFMLAGHLAGLLAISLLDVDELAGASTCCLEAAVFTELTGHEGLRAWTLAVNSLIDAAARQVCEGTEPGTEPGIVSGDGPGAPVPPDPRSGPPGEPSAPRYALADGDDSGGETLDEMLIAPGGRATPPRLIALVKGRIARFATASTRRAVPIPPTSISRAFRPPV